MVLFRSKHVKDQLNTYILLSNRNTFVETDMNFILFTHYIQM